MTIFFDCETTGLITNEALPLAQQPRIIELGGARCDSEGAVVTTFKTFVAPGIALPPEIPKITGITEELLVGAPTFAEVLPALARFFLGEEELIAHNATFDHMMLVFELMRLGKQHRFPYPSRIIDSKTRFSGKLEEWGRRVKGEAFAQSHRALDDTLLLRECWFSGVRDEE